MLSGAPFRGWEGQPGRLRHWGTGLYAWIGRADKVGDGILSRKGPSALSWGV